MKQTLSSVGFRCGSLAAVMAAVFSLGCPTGKAQDTNKTATAGSAPIRINAGATEDYTDASGNVWLADRGFTEGEIVDRGGDTAIVGTKTPALYRTERYAMTDFMQPLANGKYTVKLHFAETYEEMTAAGQRVFSFNVEGHEFKNFDVFVKAGSARKAYVETVSVEVADGKLDIQFTSQIDNPEINAIEIIPASQTAPHVAALVENSAR